MASCGSCGAVVDAGSAHCPACGRRQESAAPATEARCALHPEQPARVTCARCGSFACAECSTASGLCRKCAESSSVSWERLRAVAQAQRLVIAFFAGGLLALPASAFLGAALGGGESANLLVVGAVVVLRVGMAWAVYRLMTQLGGSVAVLWAIGAFLPNIVGLIVLLVVSSKANAFLQKAGVKVGLFGASIPETPPR